jgi:hypothetical protein
MKRPLLLLSLFCASVATGSGTAEAAPAVDFARDVRPILAKNCFACHGPDEAHRAAGLRLDLREGATGKRGGRPPAVVPGAPEKSLLLARVTAHEAGRMPPPTAGPRLTPEHVTKLRAWVRAGAPYSEHWAFVSPKRPAVPAVKLKSWPRNSIDHFVLARLEKEGLKPSPEADPYTLLRRVSLDLRGIPPTPEEVETFLKELEAEAAQRLNTPDAGGDARAPRTAYERAVERFLADPAYGERWARMWLDLARYADSAGYGSDPLRQNIWPYRDWVINAFNRNLPYDRFTIEQLAGDLLPNATLEQKIATAFHRNTMTNTEGGTDDEEWRTAAVKDRVDTSMQVWMGVTAGCAKCHTHKYDPITQKEYYSLFAVFNQTADYDQPDERPTLPLPDPVIEEQIRQANEKIAALKARLEPAPPEAEAKKIRDEIAALEKARPSLTALPVMEELAPDRRRESFLMVKGNFLEKGEKVEPGVPAAFGPARPVPDRLALARWLVSPENPLTARVAVNRFWAQLFGAGLVETEEDFGTQGELPSHPELLDWLAVAFSSRATSNEADRGTEGQRDRGKDAALRLSVSPSLRRPDEPGLRWDMKALLRLIVTSAAYRQSTRVTPALLAKDPRNRLISRGPRHRLEAEMVRDQALQLAGLLSRKIGGPSVYPPQPEGLWQAAFNGQRTWPTSKGEDRYRRGLYTFWRRTIPYPSMTAFDATSREICTVRRIRTNTPLQAFVTMNDPVYVEASQALARRILREGGSTADDHARYGLRLALCRPPLPEQVRQIRELFESELAHYRGRPEQARALATEPLGPLPEGMDPAEAAAWTVVANVLLNLDAVLTKN